MRSWIGVLKLEVGGWRTDVRRRRLEGDAWSDFRERVFDLRFIVVFDRPGEAAELARFEKSFCSVCVIEVEAPAGVAICGDQLPHRCVAEVAWSREVVSWIA